MLPSTDQHDTTAVLPFGVALGLFGRVAGSLSTYYSFGKQGDTDYRQFGPLRLNLTVRLWPLFPLGSSGGGTETTEAGPTEYAPPRGLRLGLAYEHEVRVWQFDGANSLGLLTELAALRLLASRMFGPVLLSASLGALYDWRGQFATGEAAAQVGLYLPGFRALKVYFEALGRGVPTYVQNGANHVFGPKSLARHNLGGVLSAFKGDTIAAFNALEHQAQQLANQGLSRVCFKSVELAGQTVTMRGAVVDGIARVSTAFIP